MVDSKTFLSKFERTLAEGQKALDRSKARQQDINRRALEFKSESKTSQKRFEKKIAQIESESKRNQKRLEARQDERDGQKREIHKLQVDLLKQKLAGGQAGPETARAAKNEEQGTERSATNGAKEFDPRKLGKGPRGKLIGIALSGQRSGIGPKRIVACMGKTSAPCQSDTYHSFKVWYRENNKSFHKFLYRLRKEGKEWEEITGQSIPDKYYTKYQ